MAELAWGQRVSVANGAGEGRFGERVSTGVPGRDDVLGGRLHIGLPLTDVEGVLTGNPRVTGMQADLSRAVR